MTVGDPRTDVCYITRRAEFSASHRLWNPDLSDAENDRVFRSCNWPRGHGHNYMLQVTVVGPPDPATGMVVNLKDLQAAMQVRILDKCDHRHLNEDVDFLDGVITTTENLCRRFWDELVDELSGKLGRARLHRIRIQETRDNFVDYYGPGVSPESNPAHRQSARGDASFR